ncbi:MAG TPA: methylglyoxal synthase [Synechococcales cyanobacterium M55_K2018_004]|nr:methylglyoxal synthase [Synechococcales cyanobacterium M55_K2018_004]
MPATLALIAHDSQKATLVEFVQRHSSLLQRYRLIATETTGQRIQQATGLPVETCLSGSLGGDLQLAANVVNGEVVAVFFLLDPYAPAQEPGFQALLRACLLHNVPVAINLATAEAIALQLAKSRVAHLIFNPGAGQGNAEQDLTLIQQLLEPALDLHIHITTPDVHPAELVQMAIASGADMVLASGGDGTVSAVAGALIETNVPLGIIPRGTANAFAGALGLPQLLPIRAACQTILAGTPKPVDAAVCNGVPMVLLAGIGFEAEAVELANRELKRQWGAAGYFLAGWRQMNQQSEFEVEMEADGKSYQLQAVAITVANAAPATSILAQGGGVVDFQDGLLDVTIGTASSRIEAIGTMLNLLGSAIIKRDPQQANLFHARTPSLRIVTDPPQKVVVDGEIIGTTPIEVKCIPQGLKVILP